MLEKLNVYNELSGVTTNQSEGYNTLLKHYGHWKEAQLDALSLGLYQLQFFYHNEIQRGYGGMGSYSLLADFSHAAIAADEVISIAVTQPADIVSKIRGNKDVEVSFTATMDERMEYQDLTSAAAMNDCMEDQGAKFMTTLDNCENNQDTKPMTTIDDHMKDEGAKPMTTIDDHMKDEGVKPMTIIDDHVTDQGVKPITTIDDYVEDHNEKSTITTAMDDLAEDNEIKPTVTAVTGLDDTKGVTNTNKTTQLSRARYASSCTYINPIICVHIFLD